MSDRGASSRKPGSVFNDLRLEGHFCDAIIKVEDVEFPVHKIILCECSPYFRALFIRCSTTDKKVFNVPGLSPDMMRTITEFVYTGSLSVTEDNVQELLLAANQLGIVDIVQACRDFLEEKLSPQTCIGIWQFTNICPCFELQRKAYQLILDHFEEVVSGEEFQDLTVRELTDILKRDDLNVRKESTVSEAILHWIAHRPEERRGHLLVLLSQVRLALMSRDHLGMVMSNELVKSNAECFQMVKEVMENKASLTLPALVLRESVARPRVPNVILLAIGGWSRAGPTNRIEAYDICADHWINLTDYRERPRACHGTAFLDGYVYCVGGSDGKEHFNTVRRMDLSTRTWQEAAPMHFRRGYVCITVLNGCIFAMGGYDGRAHHRTAECYRPNTNQWTIIPSMHERRSDASCTTLKNKIYVCGGSDGEVYLETCEYYSPETNQWTVIAPMNCQRSGVGIAAHAGRIFAVGGFDGIVHLRSAEAYDPCTNTWHAVSSMSNTRSNFGIAVIDDRLFVVGGFNRFSTSCNVMYYNLVTDEWSKACHMEMSRSGSCCVVHGLPNMAEYTWFRGTRPLL